MDWLRVRRRLAQLRVAQRRERDGRSWSLDDLAKASGIDKSVIHRTENVLRYPYYKPDLETIERWIRATTQRPLSAFFASFESDTSEVTKNSTLGINFPLNPSDTALHNPPSTISHNAEAASHGALISPPTLALFESILLASVERVVTALDRLGERLAPRDEQVPTRHAEAPNRRRRDRVQRGKTAR
jgi:transcriptional regulator with XRE-family HTH domain